MYFYYMKSHDLIHAVKAVSETWAAIEMHSNAKRFLSGFIGMLPAYSWCRVLGYEIHCFCSCRQNDFISTGRAVQSWVEMFSERKAHLAEQREAVTSADWDKNIWQLRKAWLALFTAVLIKSSSRYTYTEVDLHLRCEFHLSFTESGILTIQITCITKQLWKMFYNIFIYKYILNIFYLY